MIAILDRKNRPDPPAWLAAARPLSNRQTGDGQVWMPAEAWLSVPEPPWRDLGDGYAVAGRVDQADTGRLMRPRGGYVPVPVKDLRGWSWDAPIILTPEGERAFPVTYGPDWLPELSPEQERALAVAKEARTALMAKGEVPMAAACAWAAAILSLTYLPPPEVMQRIGMMDDALAVGTLSAACQITVERAEV